MVAVRENLVVSPAGGSAGAVVTGLDLSQDYGAEEVAALRKALLDHLVVALPELSVTTEAAISAVRLQRMVFIVMVFRLLAIS